MIETASPTSPQKVKLSLDNTVAIVIGRRGEGKTTLARNLARDHGRVFVFDSRWQWEGNDHYETAYLLEEVPHLLRPHPSPMRARYKSRFAKFDFPWVCRIFEGFPEMRETLFVVDEILKVSDRYVLPVWWDELVHFSRHQKVGLLITTQRPTDLHGDIRAEASDIFCFRQHHPRDIAWLTEVMGPEADQVKDLPQYKALWWRASTGECIFPVDNQTLSVVPSQSRPERQPAPG